MYDVVPRYRGRRFRKIPHIGAAPAVHLERARERAQLRTCLPQHSTRPPTGNWLEFMTGAAPYCGPRPGGTSSSLGWSVYAVKPGGRGGAAEDAAAWLLTKIRQNGHQNVIFWGHVRTSKRSGRHFYRKGKKIIYKVLNKFSCNLRSKLVRSTLTLPGPIRVKGYQIPWRMVISSLRRTYPRNQISMNL